MYFSVLGKTFVDHLYSSLQQHGIHTYKDDVTLDRGDTIGPLLFKAIESSQILVIIFSENYAHSSWCLDELSHIMKCGDSERGQIIMPIFETWKKALFDASNIAGWKLNHVANGHEAKCIKEIVDSISSKLLSLDSTLEDENLVGMEPRLEDLKQLLRIGLGGVHMVGIWGVGGGGKTTLATSLYLQISSSFDDCCFLGNIREESSQQNGLQSLQEKILFIVFNKKITVQNVELGKHTIKRMLSRRNVLIVLDDVDHIDQLKALAGCREWFGDRSRIIITTRDQHLLTTHRIDVVSPISLLSQEDATRLFNKHGYCDHKPIQNYEMLSQQIVSYAGGFPLALIVLGSFLYDKNNDEWIGTLSRLKDYPEMDIVGKLKISYDGLKPVEKELFLDIACFHRGNKEDDAMEILDACGFHPSIGIEVLKQKALITLSLDDKFDMHDLVQEMAYYIVRGEHSNNPEEHSRVWRLKDIKDMCSRNAISKLRFIRVKTWSDFDEGPFPISFHSNELRYIDWEYYSTTPFPERFQPTKLVVLKMTRSLQKELWKGYKYLPCLKELVLCSMEALFKTPDFGGLPCLQKLKLFDCGSLEEIHESLGNHASLVSVEVRYCNKLTRFSSIVWMDKLEILSIINCNALVEFPRIEAKMDKLAELSLYDYGVILVSTVGKPFTNHISLELKWCPKLQSKEGNEFHALKNFESSECSRLEKLPKDVFNENVGEVGLLRLKNGSGIKQLVVSHLPRSLRKLNLHRCGLKDGEIPTEIGELCSLQELRLHGNDFTRLDFSLSRLTSLKLLDMSYCGNLVELPELPSSLSILKANWCESLEDVDKDEIHTNCKWLSQVSIWGVKKNNNNIIRGERLLETMLQGNAVESGCIGLVVQGLEIARGFEPCLIKGGRCGMQLPENWFNDFSGFLFCATSDDYIGRTVIRMKHEFEEDGIGGWMGTEVSQHDKDLYWEDVVDDDKSKCTWVGYIPFGLLRHTSWWDATSSGVQIEIHSYIFVISWCGLKLVPKRGAESGSSSGQMETKTTNSSSVSFEISRDDDNDGHYNCEFQIEDDSKSAFRCAFDRFD